MMQYKLDILAVQEHTPWNRVLLDSEIKSIERHCDSYGFFVFISPVQIIIIDKQLQACHRETQIYNDGRIISSRFEISENNFATFVPVYAIPHSGGETLKEPTDENTENTRLQKQSKLRNRLQDVIHTSSTPQEALCLFPHLVMASR